ncbi:BfmA/BtgA family mobilization protein [Hymenobacter latericus]|uniref:BfmA/BtgA family mobilization protein n=1 Tax=Hymenobacter sp. YIM 151858-1 TaxID=2987688 RepID=UPI002227B31A|nr:BfmA/BtgA family mobilization protein [Hymenobacter sp. YIM 151858-1]UYZ61311.1 BfmA/BtgA family mobilization protein [Hymenobacter sp. YIM 151858-1]
MSTALRKRVTLDSIAYRKADAAAAEVGASLGTYTSAAVEYFATRGLDPRATEAREGQLIMQQIKKLGDRVFGFMQEQERTLLTAMLEEMLRTRITLERVLRMNEILVSNLNTQLETLSEAQLQRQQQALQLLRQRNEEAVERQVKEALLTASKQGPGKHEAPVERKVNPGQSGEEGATSSELKAG